MARVFILSPARSDGVRAGYLFNPNTTTVLGRELQAGVRQPIGKVFSFLSGLYFRGKLAYAETFSRPASEGVGAWVITSNQGLLPLQAEIDLEDLRGFSKTPIACGESRYEAPLRRDLRNLVAKENAETQYVLLGSVSTDKYAAALLEAFGEKLFFPTDFIGRGDMSRGGLMLRHARMKTELAYAQLAGAVRNGKRPPKLIPVGGENRPAGNFPKQSRRLHKKP